MSKNKKSIFTERQKVKLFNAAVVSGAVAVDTVLAVALIPISPFVALRNVIKEAKYNRVDWKYVGKGALSFLLAPIGAVACVIDDAIKDDEKEKSVPASVSVKRVVREAKQRMKNYDAFGGKYTLDDLLNQEQAHKAQMALQEKIKKELFEFSDLSEETFNRIVADAKSVAGARKMAVAARQDLRRFQAQEISKTYKNLTSETVELIVHCSQDFWDGKDQIYEYLRRPRRPYANSKDEFDAALDYGESYINGIHQTSNSAWMVHEPINWKEYADAEYHISLNVRVTKDLLQSLDELVRNDKGKIICQYKYPRRHLFDRQVLNRHDPITIYTTKRDANIEQQIVRKAAPYVRSNEGLIGEN